MVWDRQCLEDSERKDHLLNESITADGAPRPHALAPLLPYRSPTEPEGAAHALAPLLPCSCPAAPQSVRECRFRPGCRFRRQNRCDYFHPDQREYDQNQFDRYSDRDKKLFQQVRLNHPCISDPNGEHC